MKSKQVKAGAPKKISDEKLDEILSQFLRQNSLSNLNPSQLEKQTGIGRQIWRRRKGETINKLKSSFQVDMGGKGDKEYIPFPNVAEIVDTHWNNKKELIASLKMYEETIQHFYDDSLSLHKHKEQVSRLKKQLSDVLKENKLYKNDVTYYKKKYEEVAVRSKSPTERVEYGLNNVLDIKKKSNENKALSTDFASNYPELFNDE